MADKALVLICGDDNYLVTESAKKRVARLVPEAERDFGLEVIDGDVANADDAERAVNSCIESVRTESFLGGNKTTWLKNATFFQKKKEEDEDGNAESSSSAIAKLTELVKAPLPSGHTLLITTPNVPRNSSFFKACQKMGEVEDFGSNLKSWEQDKVAEGKLDTLIRQVGLEMDLAVREEFLQRAGTDTRTLVNELEKLSLYVHPNHKVTKTDIEAITCLGRETEAWDVLEAFNARDAKRTMSILRKLEGQKGVAMMLEAMLENDIRDMIVVREAVDRGWIRNGNWSANIPPEEAVILQTLPVNPKTMNSWRLRKILPFVGRFTMRELRIARYLLITMREKLVSSSLPEMFLLQTTILKIIGKRRTAVPSRQLRG